MAVAASLGPKRVRTSTTVASVQRVPSTESCADRSFVYRLYGPGEQILGAYDGVVFACHPPAVAKILAGFGGAANPALPSLLRGVEYADNIVYVHSDPALMPRRKDV